MSHCCCRVHFPRLECRTDATHVVRCALGTGVRALNWCLAASVGFSALCLAAGISRSALICRMLEVRLQRSCRRGITPWVCLGSVASQEQLAVALCESIADATKASKTHRMGCLEGLHSAGPMATARCRRGQASACWRWRRPPWRRPRTGRCRARPPWWPRSWAPRCATSCSSTPCGTWPRCAPAAAPRAAAGHVDIIASDLAGKHQD